MLLLTPALLLALVSGPPALPPTFAIPPILMYHRVDPARAADPLSRELTVSPAQFSSQLAYLKMRGIAAISVAELERRLQLREDVRHTVVLTFDDGYADQYTYALPILRKYDDSATFYIVTGELGRPRHLTWPLVERLAQMRMDIAAHGVAHDDLSAMPVEQQAYQIDTSVSALRTRLHEPIDSYAYPSGRFNRITLRLLQLAGIPLAVTTDPVYVLPPQSALEVARLRVRGDWTLRDFATAVDAGLAKPQVVPAPNGYPPGAGNIALAGVITGIDGSRLWVRQEDQRMIVVDDQEALARGAAQSLYVGRTINATGFWSGGVFYAMAIAQP